METLATVLDRWWDHAACRGMDLNLFIFEPGERYSRKKIAEAKAVCATCIVRASCLAESLKYSTTQLECYGIWGFSHGKNDANYNPTQTQPHRWYIVTANTDKSRNPDHEPTVSGHDRRDR